MKRLWPERKSLSMQHLRVSPQMSGLARLLSLFFVVLALLVVSAGAGWWGYKQGLTEVKAASGMGELELRVQQQQTKLQALQSDQIALVQQLKVETATRDQLAGELRRAQGEIARLRDEGAFFERLLTEPDRSRPLTIESFSLSRMSDERYRCRILLIQGQRGEIEFKGEYSLLLRLASGESVAWPIDGRKLPISVKQYARIESDLRVPASSELRKVEVRIYSAGGAKPQLVRTYDVKG